MAKELTFSQRYGYEPLPEPMRLEHLSDDLRKEIWNCFRLMIAPPINSSYVHEEFCKRILDKLKNEVLLVDDRHIPIPHDEVMRTLKTTVLEGEFNEVLNFIEHVANEDVNMGALEKIGRADIVTAINSFSYWVKSLLDKYEAAYWLDMSKKPYQIVPRASKEAGEATQKAVEAVHKSGMVGASTHLRGAAKHIDTRQYRDSIADSIHAVESVARKITRKEEASLGQALDILEKDGLLEHEFLKDAFKKLYRYTSNSRTGIRHAMSEKSISVGLDEALFMYGACASFAAYLTNKHRQQQGSSH